MKLFNRILEIENAEKLLKGCDYIFIYSCLEGSEEERRGNACKNRLNPKCPMEIIYKVWGRTKEDKIDDGFEAVLPDNTHTTYRLSKKGEIDEFIELLYLQSQYLVIDFTLMNVRFLGAFLSKLYMWEWNNVFFCYTEPKAYIKEKEYTTKIKFNMKNTMLGCEEIPGLETKSSSIQRLNWVTFLGFESGRLRRMEEHIMGKRENIIPVMCIPAMHVEWHNYAMEVHRDFLEKVKERDQISYVSATNPFDVYNYLCKERDSNNCRMVITPISTKPVILGALMYVLENPEDMLLWDSPYQTQPNSEESGCIFFYDLSYYIRNVKNIRMVTEEESE